jgi:hypothetical protein
MRDIKEELEKARSEIRKLDAEFIEELKKDFELSKEGTRRRLEDGKGWEELIKSMPVDLSKLLEHDKADAKKAESILKELEPRLKTVPKEILLRTQEHLALDDIVNLELATNDPVRRLYSINQAYDGNGTVDFYQSTDSNGVVEGSCGQKRLGGPAEVNPRSYAAGSGSGWQDYNSTVTQCWLWFQIPSAYIQRPGILYVWPYFDIHGYYWVRANDGYFSSKEAKITLRMHTKLQIGNLTPRWFTWVVRDRGNGNIDEDGRVDFSGYHNESKGVLPVFAGESIWVQVIAELRTHAEGSGSRALLDFQTGEGNAIRIPKVVIYVP